MSNATEGSSNAKRPADFQNVRKENVDALFSNLISALEYGYSEFASGTRRVLEECGITIKLKKSDDGRHFCGLNASKERLCRLFTIAIHEWPIVDSFKAIDAIGRIEDGMNADIKLGESCKRPKGVKATVSNGDSNAHN